MNKFKALGLNEDLLKNLESQGISDPTPIQSLTIPEILQNKDVMAEAQTGTGKTLAFLLPMFQRFDMNSNQTQGLILTPTRELALQITTEAKKLARNTGISILAVYGGQDIHSQLQKLNNNVTLVIATPGRLIDHLKRKTVSLKNLQTLVLDEADQMLHIGFKDEIELILSHTNKDKQILCFSATLDEKVKKLAHKFLSNPLALTAKKQNITLDTIDQKVIICSDRNKEYYLLQELDKTNPFMSIIFCRTKRRADTLGSVMTEKGYNCSKLHGDIPQNARQKIMKAFRQTKIQYLIATDVASRGLDISGVTHIYNYDIPQSSETYIHRIGRTGRMNESGMATTFVTPRDIALLREIEMAIKMKIPSESYLDENKSDNPRKSQNRRSHVRSSDNKTGGKSSDKKSPGRFSDKKSSGKSSDKKSTDRFSDKKTSGRSSDKKSTDRFSDKKSGSFSKKESFRTFSSKRSTKKG